MQRPRHTFSVAPTGFFSKLKAFLQTRIRAECRGFSLRIVKEPVAMRTASRSAPSKRRDLLPPMPGYQVISAHVDLRSLLNRAPAARRVWPSLALLERVLGHGGFEGIHRVDACVLRHAAQSLDLMADHLLSPGLVMLRRRIELVLRRKHRDQPTHWARTPCPSGARRSVCPADTLTDYIDLDRLSFAASVGRTGASRDGLRGSKAPIRV